MNDTLEFLSKYVLLIEDVLRTCNMDDIFELHVEIYKIVTLESNILLLLSKVTLPIFLKSYKRVTL